MGAMPPARPSSHRAMNYPLNLSFKIVAIAPQIYVSDAQGSPVCFVKQKLFKLKEDIIVFSDSSKSRQIANIKSNKNSRLVCPLLLHRSTGWRNWLDRQTGDSNPSGEQAMMYSTRVMTPRTSGIHEENPWTKVLDSILGDIPILGFLSGYFLHPAYTAARPDGTPVMRVQKQPALLRG